MSESFTLYDYWRSSSSWRVRFALALKGLAYRPIAVNLLDGASESAEHQARDPLGHVPVLELKDGTRLTESLAIIEWLDETHPGKTRLLPQDPLTRARVRQLSEIINSGIQPILNLDVLDALTERFGADAAIKKSWSQDFMKKAFSALEHWTGAYGGQYLAGDTISMADLCLIPQLYNARRNELDLTPYPRLLKVEQTCMKLDAYTESHPDRFGPKA